MVEAEKPDRDNGTTGDRTTVSPPFSFTLDSGANIDFVGHGILESAIFSILVDCWVFGFPVDIPRLRGAELALFSTVVEPLTVDC